MALLMSIIFGRVHWAITKTNKNKQKHTKTHKKNTKKPPLIGQ
jgi:hypothetical protein